jgi:uncharacterized protein (TIGR01777 family)
MIAPSSCFAAPEELHGKRILLTGASGLIGSLLRRHWPELKWIALGRRRPAGVCEWRYWDACAAVAPLENLEPIDGIIHLAGEGIADRRWTVRRKRQLLDSRVLGTANLLRPFQQNVLPAPAWMLSASAIGYYPSQGNQPVGEPFGEPFREGDPPGHGFLAELCQEWEAAVARAETLGIRPSMARLGVVLHPSGGLLARLLPLFRAGLGAPLGTGKQIMSWVDGRDVISAFAWVLRHELTGPFNLCSPLAASNEEFSRLLAHLLHRRTFLRIPSPALRLAFGAMADVMLHGARIEPARLLQSGFSFAFPELKTSLASLLH